MNKGILRFALHDEVTDAEALPHLIAIHGESGNGGRVGAANTPKQYKDVLLKDCIVRESEPKIIAKLEQYVKTFVRQWETYEGSDQILGLYLYSPKKGNGKTTTAIAIMHEFIARNYIGNIKRGLNAPHQPAFFFDVNEWQTLYSEFTRPNIPRHIAEPAAAEYYRREKIARTVPFLIMDDIGVREDVTDAFKMDLHRIINHRNAQELPTVYTSNVPLSDLERIYRDERLSDRIRDMTIQLTFTGDSKRGRRK